MLPSGLTLRHVLVVGVDGVRFDLLGIQPADRALITGQTQIAPLAVAALGSITGS